MSKKNDIKEYAKKFLFNVKDVLKTESLRQVIWSDPTVEYKRTASSDLMTRVIRLPIFFTKENIEKTAKAVVAASLKFMDQHQTFPSVMLLIPGKHNYVDGIFDEYPDETEGFIPGQQADLRADVIQIFCDYIAETDVDGESGDDYNLTGKFAFTPQEYADFMLDFLYCLQQEEVEGIGCITHVQHSQSIPILGVLSPFLISTPANFYAPGTKEEETVYPMKYFNEAGELVEMREERYGYVLSSEYPLPRGGDPLEGIDLCREDLLEHRIEVDNAKIIWTRLQYTVDHLSKAQSYLRSFVEMTLNTTTYPEEIRKMHIILAAINAGLSQETAAQKISTFESGLEASILSVIDFFKEIKNEWILIHGGAKTSNLPEMAIPVNQKTCESQSLFLSVHPTPFNEIIAVMEAYHTEQDMDKKVDQLRIIKVMLDLLHLSTLDEIMEIKQDFRSRTDINRLINLSEKKLQQLIETHPRAAQKLFVKLVFFEIEYSNLLGIISQAYGLLSNIKLLERWEKLWCSYGGGDSFDDRILFLLSDYIRPSFFKKINYTTEAKKFISTYSQKKDPYILLAALFDLLTRDFNPDSTLLKVICFILLKTPEADISLQYLGNFQFGLHLEASIKQDSLGESSGSTVTHDDISHSIRAEL